MTLGNPAGLLLKSSTLAPRDTAAARSLVVKSPLDMSRRDPPVTDGSGLGPLLTVQHLGKSVVVNRPDRPRRARPNVHKLAPLPATEEDNMEWVIQDGIAVKKPKSKDSSTPMAPVVSPAPSAGVADHIRQWRAAVQHGALDPQPVIRFSRICPDAALPAAGSAEGLRSLSAVQDIDVAPKATCHVPLGLSIASITPGFWYRLDPAWDLGPGRQLAMLNVPCGSELTVAIHNYGDEDVHLPKGTALVHLSTYKVHQPAMEWA